jgi:hypothetical protein
VIARRLGTRVPSRKTGGGYGGGYGGVRSFGGGCRAGGESRRSWNISRGVGQYLTLFHTPATRGHVPAPCGHVATRARPRPPDTAVPGSARRDKMF